MLLGGQEVAGNQCPRTCQFPQGPGETAAGGGGGEVTLGQDTVSIRIKFRLRTRPGLSAWERGLELDQRRSLGVDREGQATPEPRC